MIRSGAHPPPVKETQEGIILEIKRPEREANQPLWFSVKSTWYLYLCCGLQSNSGQNNDLHSKTVTNQHDTPLAATADEWSRTTQISVSSDKVPKMNVGLNGEGVKTRAR